MKEEFEEDRNRPADKGRDHDPDVRDDSALQPGASTISPSASDVANQNLTKTAADSFRTGHTGSDAKADPSFDEKAEN